MLQRRPGNDGWDPQLLHIQVGTLLSLTRWGSEKDSKDRGWPQAQHTSLPESSRQAAEHVDVIGIQMPFPCVCKDRKIGPMYLLPTSR